MTAAARPRIRFTDEQTVTIADLRVGDFITTIPHQSGIRGVKCDALIEAIDDTQDPRWRVRGSARGARVESRVIHTRLGSLDVPSSCTVGVRRPIEPAV